MILGTDVWRDWDTPTLAGIMANLAKSGKDSADARVALAKRFFETRLAEGVAMEANTAAHLKAFAPHAQALPQGLRKGWFERLGRHLQDQGKSLAANDAISLLEACVLLGDATAWGHFVEQSSSWQPWQPTALAVMAEALSSAGDAGSAARAKLVGHLTQVYLKDEAVCQGVSSSLWIRLIRDLNKDMPIQARQQWAAMLDKAWTQKLAGNGAQYKAWMQSLKLLDPAISADPAQTVLQSDAWKTWGIHELSDLASGLSTVGKPGQAARDRLVEHLVKTHAEDPNACKAAGSVMWSVLALRFPDMPEAIRSRWIKALEATWADGQGLEQTEFIAYLSALRRLGGDREVSNLIVRSSAWRSWDLDALSALAEGLPATEEGKAARLQIGKRVQESFLAEATTAASLSLAQWERIGRVFGTVLDQQQRQAWLERLDQTRATPEALATIRGLDDYGVLAKAMTALGAAGTSELLIRLIDKTDHWQHWDTDAMIGLAAALPADGDPARSARARIAQSVDRQWLADANRAAALSCQSWAGLVAAFAENLDQAQKEAWLQRLLQSKASDTALAQLKGVSEYMALLKAMTLLGAKDPSRVLVRLVEGSDSWKSWETLRICELGSMLVGAGDSAKGARARLADHVVASLATDPDAAKLPSLTQMGALAAACGRDVPAQTRAKWLSLIHAGYEDDVKTWASLKALGSALEGLGDANLSGSAAAIVHCQLWRSFAMQDLASMANDLSASDEQTAKAKAVLAQHILATQVKDAAAIKSVPLSMWKTLAGRLGPSLSPEQRKQWAAKVRGAYVAGSEKGAQLEWKDLLVLLDVHVALGDSEGATALLSSSTAWQSAEPKELVGMIDQLAKAGDQAKGLRGTICMHLAQKCLKVGPSPLALADWKRLCGRMAADLSAEQRAEFTQLLRGAYVDRKEVLKALAANDVKMLVDILEQLGDRKSSEVVQVWMASR